MRAPWGVSVFTQRLGFGGGYAIEPDPPKPFNHAAQVVRPESTDPWLGWESPLADLMREHETDSWVDETSINMSVRPEAWASSRWIASTKCPSGFLKPRYIEGVLAFKPIFNAARRLLKAKRKSVFLVPAKSCQRSILQALREQQQLQSIASVVIHFDDGYEVGPIEIELWEPVAGHLKVNRWHESTAHYEISPEIGSAR